MRRSELIKNIVSDLEDSVTEQKVNEILFLCERYGMLPPARWGTREHHTVNNVNTDKKIVTIEVDQTITLINEWDEEYETKCCY